MSEKKKKYYYHGSQAEPKDNYLEPRPSNVIDKEKVVFATRHKWMAAYFIPEKSDLDMQLSGNKDKWYITEMYPGAFDKLKVSGYIYFVNSKNFMSDERLGMKRNEFISKKKTKILKVEKIKNVYDLLKKKRNVNMIKFELWMTLIEKYVESRKKKHLNQ